MICVAGRKKGRMRADSVDSAKVFFLFFVCFPPTLSFENSLLSNLVLLLFLLDPNK